MLSIVYTEKLCFRRCSGIFKKFINSVTSGMEIPHASVLTTIMSQEGAQQGDPLGPLLFCLSIHPMLSSLASKLVVGYLDDITLGGDEHTLVRDIPEVNTQGQAIGLKLNSSKCEFISQSALPSDAAFGGFIELQSLNSTLLGAPLNSGSAMDDALSVRCSELALA